MNCFNSKYIEAINRLNEDKNMLREDIMDERKYSIWKEKQVKELSKELIWYKRRLEVMKIIKDIYPYSVNCEPIKLIDEFCW